MVEGRLSFTASQGQNGTTVSCMAESVAGEVTSSDATLIIAGTFVHVHVHMCVKDMLGGTKV